MAMAHVDLTIKRGDDFVQQLRFRESVAGPTIDLSDYTDWAAQVRRWANDSAVLVAFDIDTSQTHEGLVELSLSSTVTALMWQGGVWDLQASGPAGTITFAGGDAHLELDVTR